jgi:YcxB-like protein
MAEPPIVFEAPFDESLIDSAARSLVRQMLKRRLTWKLYSAAAINLVAFVIVCILLGNQPMTWVVGLIAIAPLYFVAVSLFGHRRVADILRRRYKPSAQISINREAVTIEAHERAFTLPWRDFKQIIEFHDYFLFALLSPIGGFVIPRKNMPVEAETIIREIGKTHGNFTAA